MAIRKDGLFVGSVSGGCVEGAVIQASLTMEDTVGRRLDFGVSDELAWEVGLACGGRIGIWIAVAEASVLAKVLGCHAQRTECAIHILTEERRSLQFRLGGIDRVSHKSLAQSDGTFLRPYLPKRRIFILGAVHIAQALVPMAQLLGYDVTVIDPRGLFVHSERWTKVKRVELYPDEFFQHEPLGPRDALVALSHDPKIDDPGLMSALRSSAYYIGALGSRKTHAARQTRLSNAGFGRVDLERIRGPIGLAISAVTPAEIAVSIAAEMIAHQSQK